MTRWNRSKHMSHSHPRRSVLRKGQPAIALRRTPSPAPPTDRDGTDASLSTTRHPRSKFGPLAPGVDDHGTGQSDFCLSRSTSPFEYSARDRCPFAAPTRAVRPPACRKHKPRAPTDGKTGHESTGTPHLHSTARRCRCRRFCQSALRATPSNATCELLGSWPTLLANVPHMARPVSRRTYQDFDSNPTSRSTPQGESRSVHPGTCTCFCILLDEDAGRSGFERRDPDGRVALAVSCHPPVRPGLSGTTNSMRLRSSSVPIAACSSATEML